ncbi:MAG: DUF4251 domain-containing protein [Sphingobacteriaceae bacterium]|nr:MAG: DUF4251 domain-containing protein [Sphingobacteriaceae bacterium]
MKALINTFIVALILLGGNVAVAQNSKADKEAAQEKSIKNKIDSATYTFKATWINPVRGIGRTLVTDNYDVRVTKDSVIAYLPYFGRVYMKAPINSSDGGLKFTSTNFDYKAVPKKKGGYRVTINIKDSDKANRLFFDISKNGTATLSTTGNYRDPINFNGNIVGNKN